MIPAGAAAGVAAPEPAAEWLRDPGSLRDELGCWWNHPARNANAPLAEHAEMLC